ncbi:hypothetical protein D3C87_1601710 [compost metagenome]
MHASYHLGDRVAVHRQAFRQGVLAEPRLLIKQDQGRFLPGRYAFARKRGGEDLLGLEVSPSQEMRRHIFKPKIPQQCVDFRRSG